MIITCGFISGRVLKDCSLLCCVKVSGRSPGSFLFGEMLRWDLSPCHLESLSKASFGARSRSREFSVSQLEILASLAEFCNL